MDEYQTRFSLENKNNTNTPTISLKFMLDYKSTNSTIQYRNIPDLFARDDYDFFFYCQPQFTVNWLARVAKISVETGNGATELLIRVYPSRMAASFTKLADLRGAVIAKARYLDDRERDGWFT